MKLAGQIAVVTGGGGAIGGAICLRLAEEGALVAVTDRTLEQAEKVAKLIETRGGRAVAFVADVLDPASVKAMVSAVLETFGKIGIILIIPLMLYFFFNDLERVGLFRWMKDLLQAIWPG